MDSNNRLRLRELHVRQMTRPLTDQETQEYHSLKKGWIGRWICRQLDKVYEDPDMQELLHTKPTEQRWYDLVEKLSKT